MKQEEFIYLNEIHISSVLIYLYCECIVTSCIIFFQDMALSSFLNKMDKNLKIGYVISQ